MVVGWFEADKPPVSETPWAGAWLRVGWPVQGVLQEQTKNRGDCSNVFCTGGSDHPAKSATKSKLPAFRVSLLKSAP
jgi:hypothetical protein